MEFLDRTLDHQCDAGFLRGNIDEDVFTHAHLYKLLKMANLESAVLGVSAGASGSRFDLDHFH
jgi:hypothetical protein